MRTPLSHNCDECKCYTCMKSEEWFPGGGCMQCQNKCGLTGQHMVHACSRYSSSIAKPDFDMSGIYASPSYPTSSLDDDPCIGCMCVYCKENGSRYPEGRCGYCSFVCKPRGSTFVYDCVKTFTGFTRKIHQKPKTDRPKKAKEPEETPFYQTKICADGTSAPTTNSRSWLVDDSDKEE